MVILAIGETIFQINKFTSKLFDLLDDRDVFYEQVVNELSKGLEILAGHAESGHFGHA